jgi:endonuclease/exonuclease/phosphatase family metal-dependent hydrolase
MKVVVYNSMCGAYGRSFWRMVLFHILMFVAGGQRLINWLFPENFKDMFEQISIEKPDILCLTEIPRTAVGRLKKRLRKEGFRSFSYRPSQWYSGRFNIGVMLATRQESGKNRMPEDTVHALAAGWGYAHLWVPAQNLVIVGVHLALNSWVHRLQLRALSKFVLKQKNLGRRIIVAGDFNCTEAFARKTSALFRKAKLMGSRLRTFPNGLPNALRWDLDHVFCCESFIIKQAKAISRFSDHMMITCTLGDAQRAQPA